jgi:FlaA1/EpsC-like NDP-sugar epimerase
MSPFAVVEFQAIVRHLARFHGWLVRLVQLTIFLVAGLSAFLLRFDFNIPGPYRRSLYVALVFWVVTKASVFQQLDLNRGWWRYTSVPDLIRLATANSLSSSLACAGILLFGPPGFPRSLYVLDFLLCAMMTAGVRVAVRVALEASRHVPGAAHRRTLIYGAGSAGVALLREIRQNQALGYDVVGFVDDLPEKVGGTVHRVTVYGPGASLPAVVKSEQIEMVLIAVPAATGAEMSAILGHCHAAAVAYKTVPGLAEIIDSGRLVSQIRDVAVEDLLGRHPVQLDQSGIRARIANNVILVTGAAGSIGSELCRQICRFHPAAVVACDISETGLFHLEREIRQKFPKLQFIAEVGNIQNRQRLRDIFRRHVPAIVYHAAAYKHVPLMESHAFEAVENNVLGTYNLAVVAGEFAVEDFVMISSDKAVRPTSIMGATKRVAELVIGSLQNGGPRFVSVRFGNVLASNGSVVPLFKQQIAAGGPLTVTHPEMRRYFMTIPEAAQLVVQASTMGKGGEIFVLDMGQPVRIVDLARQLIRLSGLRPDTDIRLEFTGLRPGEKLYEELNLADEETVSTRHEKIKAFTGCCLPYEQALDHLSALRKACESRDLRMLMFELKDVVPDYNPSKELLRRITEPEPARTAGVASPSQLNPQITFDLTAASGD